MKMRIAPLPASTVRTLVAGTSWSTKPARKPSDREAAVDAVAMVAAVVVAAVEIAVAVAVDAVVTVETAAIAVTAGNFSPHVLSSSVLRAIRPCARSAPILRENSVDARCVALHLLLLLTKIHKCS